MKNTTEIPFSAMSSLAFCVYLDGEVFLLTRDYELGVAVCKAWRGNHPRENKNRIRLGIV